MGIVHAEITLKNVFDEGNARQGNIRPEDVRTETVTAIVDTGSLNLVITEELRLKLGLGVDGEKISQEMAPLEKLCNSWEAIPCTVPFLDEERHLLIIKP